MQYFKLMIMFVLCTLTFPEARAQSMKDVKKEKRRLAKQKDDAALKSELDSVLDNVAGKNLKGQSEIEVVGNGNIQQSLTNGTPLEASTGLGIIYTRNWNAYRLLRTLEMDIVINVAATTDTVSADLDDAGSELQNRRDFGSYILQPINSKQAISANINLYFGSGDSILISKHHQLSSMCGWRV